jgi:hypothetical protein
MVPVGRLAVLRTTPKHQLITASQEYDLFLTSVFYEWKPVSI